MITFQGDRLGNSKLSKCEKQHCHLGRNNKSYTKYMLNGKYVLHYIYYIQIILNEYILCMDIYSYMYFKMIAHLMPGSVGSKEVCSATFPFWQLKKGTQIIQNIISYPNKIILYHDGGVSMAMLEQLPCKLHFLSSLLLIEPDCTGMALPASLAARDVHREAVSTNEM